MLTYCVAQGKLFNLAETQLSICKMGVIISTMWILLCGLSKIITINYLVKFLAGSKCSEQHMIITIAVMTYCYHKNNNVLDTKY